MLVSFGLMALPTQEETIQTTPDLIEYGVEAAAAGFYALCGFPLLLFGDIEWKEVAHGGGWRRAIAVGRGILLALPLLFIFRRIAHGGRRRLRRHRQSEFSMTTSTTCSATSL